MPLREADSNLEKNLIIINFEKKKNFRNERKKKTVRGKNIYIHVSREKREHSGKDCGEKILYDKRQRKNDEK